MKKNDQEVLRLGLEELAVAVSLTGEPDSAKGILVSNLGELSRDEERGRIMAANHSLMAKGLLLLEGNTSPKLVKEFESIVSTMTKYDFSLRLSTGAGLSERILAYYYRDGRIIKHQNFQGVSHHLSWTSKQSSIVQDCISFLEVDQCKDFECPILEMPESVLEEAKTKAEREPGKVLSHLRKAGIPDKIAKLLGDDMKRPDFRGSVLRIERKDGEMISDRGFMVLVRKPRIWIFTVFDKDGKSFVRIHAGTQTAFEKELSALIKP